MCGIVGYTGKQNCMSILLRGLGSLAYRGYDSAGVAIWNGTTIAVTKERGKLFALEDALDKKPIEGTTGIGHTRWATHGEPNVVNAHPHTDAKGQLALVHNGIIENYRTLKEQLLREGVTFVSETDTEVVAQMIGKLYDGDPKKAVLRAMNKLEGTFALAILFRDEPDTLYCVCNGSPMVVGRGRSGSFVASDIPALLPYTRKVTFLENRQMAILQKNGIRYYDRDGNPIEKEITEVEWDVEAARKGNFEHFMLKEIHEQPDALLHTIEQYVSSRTGCLREDAFPWTKEEANQLKRLRIVSCGSAYHAGLVGKKFLEHLAKLPVEVEVASEYRYSDALYSENEPMMLISQSGETADTIAAMRMEKSRNQETVAICNVIGSTIARECDRTLFTYAGPEIAVAATKSYLTQTVVLFLLALDLAEKRGWLTHSKVQEQLERLKRVPDDMRAVLARKEQVQAYANRHALTKKMFFIGRGLDHALCLEAALKLKEIAYIHTDAYAAGELKHGTIALVEDGSLVISVATQKPLLSKMASNMEEVRVRGADILAITNGSSGMEEHCDEQWDFPEVPDMMAPFLAVIPLQLLAYYIGVARGCSIDQPRNLAKSVTVE